MRYIDWGIIDYRTAWERQKTAFQVALEAKQAGLAVDDSFILCEHRPVYTLGRHGKAQNMLLSAERLQALGAELVQIDRGGDITYHGPGQVVGYPIVDIEHYHLGLKAYIHNIEELIIRTIAHWGIHGERMEGATGVWIDVGQPACRKIAAIGVKCSHYVTMHGFALNVNTDLRYFQAINPCGFVDKGVTSIEKETGRMADLSAVKQQLWLHAQELFDTTDQLTTI